MLNTRKFSIIITWVCTHKTSILNQFFYKLVMNTWTQNVTIAFSIAKKEIIICNLTNLLRTYLLNLHSADELNMLGKYNHFMCYKYKTEGDVPPGTFTFMKYEPENLNTNYCNYG